MLPRVSLVARSFSQLSKITKMPALQTPPTKYTTAHVTGSTSTALMRTVAEAVEAETGVTPVLSTSGGTSDARFLRAVCPVIEFGLVNATMHKTNEAVAVEDLVTLSRIYTRIARDVLAG